MEVIESSNSSSYVQDLKILWSWKLFRRLGYPTMWFLKENEGRLFWIWHVVVYLSAVAWLSSRILPFCMGTSWSCEIKFSGIECWLTGKEAWQINWVLIMKYLLFSEEWRELELFRQYFWVCDLAFGLANIFEFKLYLGYDINCKISGMFN